MSSECIRCEQPQLELMLKYFKAYKKGGSKLNEATPRAGHPVFYELVEEIASLHERKNQDYGDGNPFGNFLEARNLGVTPFKGVLVRLSDKWKRICTLSKKKDFQGQVKDESLEDTLMDNAVYSLIAIVLLREERKEVAHTSECTHPQTI